MKNMNELKNQEVDRVKRTILIDAAVILGAIKAVALAIAILAGVKLFSVLAVWLGLYSIEGGWML